MEVKSELKIALIQQEIAWENLPANLEYFEDLISKISPDTDLAVLPEMFTTGFSMNPEKFEEESLQASVNAMQSWSATNGIAICGSLMVKENGSYFNRFYWFEPNGNSSHYNKAHLFRMGEEQLHYAKGQEQVLIHYKGWKIAPRRTTTYDYDLLIFVANWPERRAMHWRALTLARAIENQAFLVAVNRIGEDGNGVNHSGDSLAISPIGEVILDAAALPSVFSVDLKYAELEKYREAFPVGLDTDTFEIKKACNE